MQRWARSLAISAFVAALAPWAAAPVAAVDTGTYHLPAPSGTSLYVTQGNDTGALGGDHTGVSLYAYDLAAPGGVAFEVAAARAGIVASVRGDVPDGACPGGDTVSPPPCWSEVDHVVVDHLDGTAALYLHLAQHSPAGLAVGDAVALGQVLGLAGSSGAAGPARLHFMVMAGPAAPGDPPWWRQSVGPVAFADGSVLAVHSDGIPGAGLDPDGPYVSENPGPAGPPIAGEPMARPASLPARLPWAAGERHVIVTGEDMSMPDATGAAFEVVGSGQAGDPVTTDTQAYPLFGGTLRYAGCATGASAPLGRIVVVEREADGHAWQAVHAHLSSVDPLLEAALAAAAGEPISVAPDAPIGTFGSSVTASDGTCEGTDGGPVRLWVSLLQDALVGSTGSIAGGTPVYPWPFTGASAYEPLPWWRGPMRAIDIADGPGAPKGDWTERTTADRSHVPYGSPVELVVRVRGAADLREVRFLASHPDWPARRALARYPGLEPGKTWRVLAVCRPPDLRGQPRTTRGCRWQGDARSASVSYRWDPTLAEKRSLVPWLPPARAAINRDGECVPATFDFEVFDAAGYRTVSERVRVAGRCDARGPRLGRMVNLDPLAPPAAPQSARVLCVGSAGELGGCVSDVLTWRDVSSTEQGFRIYAQNAEVYRLGVCRRSLRSGPWLVATLRPGSERWTVDARPWNAIEKTLGSGFKIESFKLSISAYNEAGESGRSVAEGKVQSGDDVIC